VRPNFGWLKEPTHDVAGRHAPGLEPENPTKIEGASNTKIKVQTPSRRLFDLRPWSPYPAFWDAELALEAARREPAPLTSHRPDARSDTIPT
jgi:hypothetical protein